MDFRPIKVLFCSVLMEGGVWECLHMSYMYMYMTVKTKADIQKLGGVFTDEEIVDFVYKWSVCFERPCAFVY